MGGKRVLVIAAHRAAESFGASLAEAYADQARRLGHEVTCLNLNMLRFDPVLRRGYHAGQALEPDLTAAQDAIRQAGHVTFIYPIWWGSVPAVLKGFIDRVFLPGFAFQYRKGKNFPEQLLTGRAAHIIATMDTPPWYFSWIYFAPGLRQMKKNTLEFCGIRPVKTLALGPVLHSSAKRRGEWVEKVRGLAGRI